MAKNVFVDIRKGYKSLEQDMTITDVVRRRECLGKLCDYIGSYNIAGKTLISYVRRGLSVEEIARLEEISVMAVYQRQIRTTQKIDEVLGTDLVQKILRSNESVLGSIETSIEALLECGTAYVDPLLAYTSKEMVRYLGLKDTGVDYKVSECIEELTFLWLYTSTFLAYATEKMDKGKLYYLTSLLGGETNLKNLMLKGYLDKGQVELGSLENLIKRVHDMQTTQGEELRHLTEQYEYKLGQNKYEEEGKESTSLGNQHEPIRNQSKEEQNQYKEDQNQYVVDTKNKEEERKEQETRRKQEEEETRRIQEEEETLRRQEELRKEEEAREQELKLEEEKAREEKARVLEKYKEEAREEEKRRVEEARRRNQEERELERKREEEEEEEEGSLGGYGLYF